MSASFLSFMVRNIAQVLTNSRKVKRRTSCASPNSLYFNYYFVGLGLWEESALRIILDSGIGIYSRRGCADTVDIVSKKKRSEIMSKITSKDTTPERVVRSLLHSLGFRFRLHRKDLPGSPDIVLPKHNTIIFVNGCFWHRHDCPRGQSLPRTNTEFWKKKFQRTMERDAESVASLESRGYNCIVVWECQTRDLEKLKRNLISSISVDR